MSSANENVQEASHATNLHFQQPPTYPAAFPQMQPYPIMPQGPFQPVFPTVSPQAEMPFTGQMAVPQPATNQPPNQMLSPHMAAVQYSFTPEGFAPNKIAEVDIHDEHPQPLEMEEEPSKEELQYDFNIKRNVDIVGWLKQGWRLYRRNWIAYTGFELLFWCITMLCFWGQTAAAKFPYIVLILNFVQLIVWPMRYPSFVFKVCEAKLILFFPCTHRLGYFIAGSHIVRHQSSSSEDALKIPLRSSNLFRGIYLIFPLLLLTILYSIAVGIGLFCFIIPGIYLAITLSFAPFLYIEYHHSRNNQFVSHLSFGVIDALTVSRRVIHKYFCQVFLFFLLVFVLQILGFITIVGLLVVIPWCELSYIYAFNDLFTLVPHKGVDNSIVCCCDNV